MTKNVGRIDQVLRISLSLVLIYIGFIDESFIADFLSSIIVTGIGIVNLIVSLTQVCPLYLVTGINTCKQKEK